MKRKSRITRWRLGGLWPLCIAVVALMVVLSGLSAAYAIGDNGGTGVAGGDPAIVVGQHWYATSTDTPPAFFWSGGGTPFNLEGPFTFNSAVPVTVYVTDDFLKGDVFRIYDFGVPVGDTGMVPIAPGLEIGPDAAFADPTYSSGTFALAAGAHSITIQTIQNPYNGGRGYIQVLPPSVDGIVDYLPGAMSAAEVTSTSFLLYGVLIGIGAVLVMGLAVRKRLASHR